MREDVLFENWMGEWMIIISLALAFLRFVRAEYPTLSYAVRIIPDRGSKIDLF